MARAKKDCIATVTFKYCNSDMQPPFEIFELRDESLVQLVARAAERNADRIE